MYLKQYNSRDISFVLVPYKLLITLDLVTYFPGLGYFSEVSILIFLCINDSLKICVQIVSLIETHFVFSEYQILITNCVHNCFSKLLEIFCCHLICKTWQRFSSELHNRMAVVRRQYPLCVFSHVSEKINNSLEK